MVTTKEAAKLHYWCVIVYSNENSKMNRFHRATLTEAYTLVHRALASGNYVDIFNAYHYVCSFKPLLNACLSYGNGFSAMHDSIICNNDAVYDMMFVQH